MRSLFHRWLMENIWNSIDRLRDHRINNRSSSRPIIGLKIGKTFPSWPKSTTSRKLWSVFLDRNVIKLSKKGLIIVGGTCIGGKMLISFVVRTMWTETTWWIANYTNNCVWLRWLFIKCPLGTICIFTEFHRAKVGALLPTNHSTVCRPKNGKSDLSSCSLKSSLIKLNASFYWKPRRRKSTSW